MLLVLHNLPKDVTSFDIRQLIKEQCGLREVILDNLLDEGPGKRITVGLAEEEEAAIVMRKLNGLHYKKCQLFVEDVRKKKLAAQTYPVLIPAGLQPQAQKPWFQYPAQKPAESLQVNHSNMPYYMTQNSNNMVFGKPTPPTQQNTSTFNQYYTYKPNDMLQTANNFMTYPIASNPTKIQAPDAPPSFKSYQNDRDKHGDRRDNTSLVNWRENKSPPSKRHENFGNFSQRESRFGDRSSGRNKNTEVLRSRDDDRSPPRGRNLFRDQKRSDRRDEFDSSRRSRSSRSNQRDKNDYMNERQSVNEQNSSFALQRDRQFDQQERRHAQKRHYEQVEPIAHDNVERPERSFGNVYENSTTFSSTPENAFFTKSNRSIFNKIIGSRGLEETSNNKVQFPSPKQNTFKPQPNSNPHPTPKRARFEPPPQYFGNKKYVNPNAPSNKATDLQKMMNRHSNWRSQSATLLAKEVIKNASSDKIQNTTFKNVLKKLRECIMSRLDVIMGDKIATNLDDILIGYRNKFNTRDDTNFFKAVMEKIERESEENADEVAGPIVGKEKQNQESGKFNKGPIVVNPYYSPSPNVTQIKQQHQFSGKINKGQSFMNPHFTPRSQLKPNLATTGKPKGLISQNRPKMPFVKDPMTMPRLPKYPNSDKQGYKQSQKNALLEHEEGFYTMEPEFERAVNEEVDKLVECYVEACEPSLNKDENTIRNKLITSTADEFKKIIKLNVTKRVLNVTDGLALRIFSSPKPPPKAALDEFCKKHGAISLKQSDTKKMFIATCNNYENYDRLVAMQTANFGSVTITIKPFQVLGPVTKKNIKANQTTVGNAVEDFTKDVDDLEIDLTNDVNDDTDVMLVENEQSEVVVIRDDLDKSFNSENASNDVDENNDNGQEINDIKALSNDKVDDSNKDSVSNEKVAAVETIFNSNYKDDSNVVIDNNEKDNISNEKIEGCKDKVVNTKSKEINTDGTNVLDSLDDILNEVDDILEDDLEDF